MYIVISAIQYSRTSAHMCIDDLNLRVHSDYKQ